MQTIKEAKEFLYANWDKGTRCPCCNQHVKLYKRPLHKGMAIDLIRVYKATRHLPPGEFIHVESILQTGNRKSYSHNFALSRFWGLAIRSSEVPENQSAKWDGKWRLTQLGIDFVLNRVKVPKRVHTYNSTKYGQSVEMITIREALTDKLNYEHLMNE